MRRVISVLSVATLMGAMLVASALPVFAAASGEDAGCKGIIVSTFSTESPAGATGEDLSTFASEEGGAGQLFGVLRSCNLNAPPEGGGP
jgi:hypothetical protein